jgi:type VI secretion system secreted protein Hcp
MTLRPHLLAPAALLALQSGVVQIHAAQEDFFLKLDGITGESTNNEHKGWIEVESFSWGASNPTTIGSATGGAGAGKATFQPFTITKRMDSTSPTLFLHCASGKHIANGVVQIYRKAGGDNLKLDLLETIDLTDVLLTEVDDAGSNDVPQESVKLEFGKFLIVPPTTDDKNPVDTTDPVDPGWDILTNTQE